MNATNNAGDELADIGREFRAFDRLPKAVREAINIAPIKIAAAAVANRNRTQAAMLSAVERTISKLGAA